MKKKSLEVLITCKKSSDPPEERREKIVFGTPEEFDRKYIELMRKITKGNYPSFYTLSNGNRPGHWRANAYSGGVWVVGPINEFYHMSLLKSAPAILQVFTKESLEAIDSITKQRVNISKLKKYKIDEIRRLIEEGKLSSRGFHQHNLEIIAELERVKEAYFLPCDTYESAAYALRLMKEHLPFFTCGENGFPLTPSWEYVRPTYVISSNVLDIKDCD